MASKSKALYWRCAWPGAVQLAVLLVLVLLASAALSPGLFKALVKAAAIVALVYAALALASQVLVLGHTDLEVVVVGVLRLSSLALFSLSIAGCIDVPELLRAFHKLSPSLGVSLALSIKMLKSLPRLWITASKLYAINACCNSYLRKIATLVLALKAFLFLSVYSLVQSAEALATRPGVFARQAKPRVREPQ
ncbi:MAG: hypothetical protein ACP5KA_06790 [Desulfurococcaceae archaeon]